MRCDFWIIQFRAEGETEAKPIAMIFDKEDDAIAAQMSGILPGDYWVAKVGSTVLEKDKSEVTDEKAARDECRRELALAMLTGVDLEGEDGTTFNLREVPSGASTLQ